MDDSVLAPWRDLSIVWFSLWTMLCFAVPGVAFFFALKYLRRFVRWLKMPLMTAQVWALRIQYGTQRTSERVAGVAIAAHSTSARVRTTVRGIIDFLFNP